MVIKYYWYDTSIFISIYRYLIYIDLLLIIYDLISILYLRIIYNGDLLLLFIVICCCCLYVVVYSGGGY